MTDAEVMDIILDSYSWWGSTTRCEQLAADIGCDINDVFVNFCKWDVSHITGNDDHMIKRGISGYKKGKSQFEMDEFMTKIGIETITSEHIALVRLWLELAPLGGLPSPL